MRTCRCEAIVLGVADYREADRLVTLLTLEQGRLKGVAVGAKRSSRRFGPALEPFARISVDLAVREGLSRLAAADIVTLFPRLRGDLEKISHAAYACELADRFLPEGVPNPRLFRLLQTYLERLDLDPFEPGDRRFLEMNLLNILGYRPVLDRCCRCDSNLDSRGGSPAPDGSGLLCTICGGRGENVSPVTIRQMEACLATGRFGSVPFSPDLLREAGLLLDTAIAVHLQHPLKSLRFLRELSGERAD